MKRSSLLFALLLALATAAVIAGCGSSDDKTSTASSSACPTDPVPVVATVGQWGDIASRLAGDCGKVTTLVNSTAIDPHDFEPTSADLAKFSSAKLVVENGLDYDAWADKAIKAVSPAPAIVNGGEVAGVKTGENPHIWYSPDYVFKVADAITAKLKQVNPGASDVYDAQAASWKKSMQPYKDTIAQIKADYAGRSYGATETVFDYMASALGLKDLTPGGFAQATANESDPAPGDVKKFETALDDGSIDLLVYNTQTTGSVPEAVRKTAEGASVPVVDVTETPPDSSKSFADWQTGQLKALQQALAKSNK